MMWGTPDIQAQIEAIAPNYFEEGSEEEFVYRWCIAELAKGFNIEKALEGEEYALERLPGFLYQHKDYRALGLLERMKEQVLQHATYLQAQETTIKALNEMILGDRA